MTAQIDEKERAAFLRDEWLFLQNQYEDFDKRSLTIKSWISTGAIAGLAIGFGTTVNYAYLIPVLIGMITAIFSYLEAYWKMFQYGFGDRIRIIEAYFRNDADVLFKDPAPFQAYHWWYRTYSQDEPIFPYESGSRPKRRIMAVAPCRIVWRQG